MTSKECRIVFMGTPDFAVYSLKALIEQGYNVVGVVSQPDRPKGRKRVLTPPPVKVEAENHGLPVLQPEKLRKPEAVSELLALQPELIVTAAYGQILPKAVLEAPRFGCINVHGSLLPKYRGGAPVHYAVMNGEAVTGVTIMYMAEGLDTGDMISKVEVPILEEDTTGTMFDKLAVAGASLLVETIPQLLQGKLQAVPQDHEAATYARNISREDERIDWSRSSREIFNHIRGLHPWPTAFTLWEGNVFKVWAAEPPSADDYKAGSEAPGTVLEVADSGIRVRTGDGSIRLTVIQPFGKKAMPVSEFARSGKMWAGMLLGGQEEA